MITLSGHISKTLNPDDRYSRFDLRDHPEYSGSNYFLGISGYGSTNKWIEAGSKVNVTGMMVFSERGLVDYVCTRNAIEVDNSIKCDRNHRLE